jgi:molecular chaperone HtpG
MQDMMKMYDMYGMGMGDFGSGETLVLNANNSLVQYLLENQEGDKTDLICKQLYDLAMISHAPLKPEAMTEFIARSNEILGLLTK